MAKLTKAQAKRLLKSIDSKSKRLWGRDTLTGQWHLPTPDMIAIEKIVARCLKRLG
jgi:hypothetical protein